MCWDGVDHDRILEWVNTGPGAALTERMEAWLKGTAEALDEAVTLTQQAMQRLEPDWSGQAAQGASSAMRVLRDFSDQMYYLSRIADITAFGQSSSAGYARTTVPPKVEVGPAPVPVGTPADIVAATRDYQDQQAAAKEAEQRARDVMREYTTVTQGRIDSLRTIAPVPRVVLEVDERAAPGPAGSSPAAAGPATPSPAAAGPAAASPAAASPAAAGPAASTPAAAGPADGAVRVPEAGPGRAAGNGPTGQAGPTGNGQVAPDHAVGRTGPAGVPGGTGDQADGPRPHLGPPGRRFVEPGGPGSPSTGPIRSGDESARRPRDLVIRDPLRQPVDSARRSGTPEPAGRNPARSGFGGVAPVGGSNRSEDTEHEMRYGLPSSEPFEPETRDGVLVDPYHPGARVPPPSIGAEDEDRHG